MVESLPCEVYNLAAGLHPAKCLLWECQLLWIFCLIDQTHLALLKNQKINKIQWVSLEMNFIISKLFHSSAFKFYLGNTDNHLTFPQICNRLPRCLKTLYNLLSLTVHLEAYTKALQPHESKYVMVRTLPSPNLCTIINESIYIE